MSSGGDKKEQEWVWHNSSFGFEILATKPILGLEMQFLVKKGNWSLVGVQIA